MEISIIGAGPRGVIVLDHLLKNANQSIKIDLFDPFDIGGKVWQVTQDKNLIMNTPAEQIQLFPNQHSLLEWAKSEAVQFIYNNSVIPNDIINDAKNLSNSDYANRRLVGAYLKWGYQKILEKYPNANINFYNEAVTAIHKQENNFNIQSKSVNLNTDKIIVTIDPSINQLDKQSKALNQYAEQNNLNIFNANYPPNVNFDQIQPKHNVIIRGLGLNFFDYMTMLTQSRGGHYEHNDDGSLKYIPSGKEPYIIVGSRRSLPHYPKALNQDGKISNYKPVFVTDTNMNKNHPKGKDKYNRMVKLFKYEMKLRYYTKLLQKINYPINIKEFTQKFTQVNDPDKIVEKLNIPKKYKINWNYVLNPISSNKYNDNKIYQQAALKWLTNTVHDAKLGSQTGPLTSAFALNRSMRSKLRNIFANNDDDFKSLFLNRFMATSNFLTMGAPAIRVEQLIALINAGIVQMLPPSIQIDKENQHFIAYSKYNPKESYQADSLIFAQLPKVDLMHNQNPLIRQTVKDGLITYPTLNLSNDKSMSLKSVKINQNTYQVINNKGQLDNDLFVFGGLTEGTKITTNVFPIAGQDDSKDAAQKISEMIFK